ncbi:hypothetical protein DYB34_001833 [Aphanomyces astaci]|uniref:Uncharacterized protein n=1 Tax=Aphanomyces astaci TaxID=112090 RepID=A0A3R6ZHQ1_APHAT|nr:hypothetical protein DYB34_001833 [Aphanomyces astaci]
MTLLELTAQVVGQSCDIEDILSCIPFLSKEASTRIWRHMKPARLRDLEILVMNAAPDTAVLDEFEQQWEAWTVADASVVFDGHESSRYFGNEGVFIGSSSLVPPRPFRALYWERVFRVMLATTTTTTTTTPMHLFQNVVYEVKVRGNELTTDSVGLLLALTTLHRVEIHHLIESSSFWTHASSLVQHSSTLRELCILHSKLSSLQPLLAALRARKHPILSMLEFVSITLRGSAFTDLVTLVDAHVVRGMRLTNSIPEDAASIFVPAVTSLDTVLVQHHDLNDLDMPPFCRTTRLSLGSNALSSVSFLSRCVHLVELDVSHNDLGDASISTLATSCLPQMPKLTKLFVFNCHFSAAGAAALFTSIASPASSIQVLNAGRNYLGPAAQLAVLAPFLSSPSSVTSLHLNYIGLGSAISHTFCMALQSFSQLTQLSLGENRLRDQGAASIFASLPFPMQALDLSGNLITRQGLSDIANHITSSTCSSPRRRRTKSGEVERHKCWIEEVNLRSNQFDAADMRDTLAKLHMALPTVYANEWRHNTHDYQC